LKHIPTLILIRKALQQDTEGLWFTGSPYWAASELLEKEEIVFDSLILFQSLLFFDYHANYLS